MAVKKKTKKKQTKSKRTPSNKMTSKKKTAKRKLARKRETPKKLAKKAAQKRATVKTTAGAKKTIGRKTATAYKKQVRKKSQSVDTVAFPPEGSGARSGRQSGDLQALSNVQRADSESVDELIEEGSPFEAGVVTGVEDAGDADEREVRTHEVPQDDVPEEYLDKK
jgi:hypothetical protein